MSIEFLAQKSLDVENALALHSFLRDWVVGRPDAPITYVMDEEGNTFSGVRLEEHKLTDGSTVYNVVLLRDRQ